MIDRLRLHVLIAFLWVFAAAPPAFAAPPNLVLIVIDDLGYGDLGCYGNADARTPNIDRLAAEGMRFTDFHSNGSMCTPTRAALLTGLYQQRFGKKFEGPLSGLSQYDDGLPLAAVTIAEVLQRLGYATGMYGKWHLGYHPPLMPTRQGFADFRGLVSGDGDHHSHIDRSGRKDWWHNESIEMHAGYSVDLITQYSVDFIERHQDEPFFLYVPHLAIHFPWQGPGDAGYREEGTSYHNLSKLGKLAQYDVGETVQSMVESIDTSVARIVDALKRLKLDERTLVIFISDNGGYLQYSGGYHKISSNGPLRGQKGDLYEGGHRVPAIAWWPGKIPPGAVVDQTVMTFDLFPTLVNLAQGNSPEKLDSAEKLDGMDITPLLLKQSALASRTLYWRMGDDKAVRRGRWKLLLDGGAPPELYDLNQDLAEQNNQASQHPRLVAELKASLAQWEASVDSSTP